jgi:hypothetical protein
MQKLIALIYLITFSIAYITWLRLIILYKQLKAWSNDRIIYTLLVELEILGPEILCILSYLFMLFVFYKL